MKKVSTAAGIVASGLETAWENVTASFEWFCLTAGVATLSEMISIRFIAQRRALALA
jgi:hypothetical protein